MEKFQNGLKTEEPSSMAKPSVPDTTGTGKHFFTVE